MDRFQTYQPLRRRTPGLELRSPQFHTAERKPGHEEASRAVRNRRGHAKVWAFSEKEGQQTCGRCYVISAHEDDGRTHGESQAETVGLDYNA